MVLYCHNTVVQRPSTGLLLTAKKKTGVTTFKLQHEIDTGNMLLQEKIKIEDDETAGTLHDKMMETGADLLLKTIRELEKGNLKEIEQRSALSLETSTSLRHAPKIFTETCEINWNKPVEEIYNLIRGLSPYPAAFTFLNGKKLKIFASQKEISGERNEPGNYVTDHKTFLKFAAADGFISVNEIQLEGKKRMKIEDFLRGWREG
jgi:methionyl-tRNA formyltransferase